MGRVQLGGLVCLFAVGVSAAADLTVVSFGGASQDAQSKAFYQPFSQSSGVKVVPDAYNGELERIRAAKETGTPAWDVVEVESPELLRGCEGGLFEKLSWSRLGQYRDFVPGAASSCGAGIFVWSTVMAYRDAGKAPANWADFWDVKKYPGKRALRKGAKYNLEFALLADGVKGSEVYKQLATPAGVERAFRKLDQLKPNLVWWEAGDQPQQLLGSGQVVMSSAYSGRIAKARHGGAPLRIVWRDSIYDFDSWAIIKGSRNKEAALNFIAASTQPAPQAAFAKLMFYGPTRYQSMDKVDPHLSGDLPTAPANLQDAIPLDVVFWALRGEALEKRFADWVKS